MPHCQALDPTLDHDRIDDILDLRESLWARSRSVNYGGSWRTAKFHKVTANTKKLLHNTCQYFKTVKDQLKFTVMQDWLYVYTNNYSIIQNLDNLGLDLDQITTIKLNRPSDTVRSKSLLGSIRTYFKQAELTESELHLITTFIDNNKEFIRPSLGLQYFLERGDFLFRNYFFIDHITEKTISAFELMTPNLIRKIVPIIK